ncbi:hypothetical protein NUU61_002275 [Penicillium alfredii]|uniref:Non-structural maintenance of chromosomes element 4 n=1 Tax=Penicillium alfredii TaxID=1506179 RepID=A0A9W9FRE7_9EURO|nr:uncharacterized protein NUU61_002275 [Penicillium alfredii]KAJ5104928.1 hypothetical protein NUU61_002275 [Penicillium alfredii]
MARSSQNKRRRLTDRTTNIQSQVPSSQGGNDKRYYDPDQDAGERRQIRRGLRDLTRELNGNDGLYKTVEKANEIFVQVKQTSDATIDSRLLVSAADLSHKKTSQLALGESTAGIDVDEFVSKCISFMRDGPESTTASPNGTQRRSRVSRTQREANDSDDEDVGDAMNWDWLGRTACFPYNARPAVSGWLLGPLSLQKRARQQIQRREAERIDPSLAVQPQDLEQQDLDQQENSNLTVMCSEINRNLADTQKTSQEMVEERLSQEEDPSPDRVQEVMDQYNIADDGGIPLFRFCINPRSFGQSVENMFYVSFLVRDGTVGVSVDSRQLPTLHASAPYAPSEAQKKGIQKHQAVFSLDFETWEQLIEVFEIEESIIPHREETMGETRRGWHG